MVRRTAWIATLLCWAELGSGDPALAAPAAAPAAPARTARTAAAHTLVPVAARAPTAAPARTAAAHTFVPVAARAPTSAPARTAPARTLVPVATPSKRPAAAPAAATPPPPRWETLPPPGPLPEPAQSGTFASDDLKLWYASFGEGDPVVLLHGGLGNADHYGDIVSALAAKRRVIVLDSRGHGRSTRSQHGISYQQMAGDVIALLDHLAIERAAIVGWSDGGATGLELAARYPARLTKLFLLGTNYSLAGMKPQAASHTFSEYFARCRREYAKLSPAPQDLNPFLQELRAMWASQPTFTDEQIQQIQTPVLVALGDHDEAIRLDHDQNLAKLLPRGRFVLLPKVSHFAMWQDPKTFLAVLTKFLDEKVKAGPKAKAAPKPARRPLLKPKPARPDI